MSATTDPTRPSRRRDRYHVLDPATIRERRLALRLPVESLADLLGVSAGAVRHLEDGGEQNHLSISFVSDLARVLAMTVPEILSPCPPTPGGDGDLVDPDDPVTVGRILAEVGTVHVDVLADGLSWTLGRTLWALTGLADRLPAVGQRLSWLADSQVTVVHAPGDRAPVAPVTRRSVAVWGLNSEEAAVVEWVARKGSHTSRGRTTNPVTVAKLKAAGILTDGDSGTTRKLTDDARFNLCLDEI